MKEEENERRKDKRQVLVQRKGKKKKLNNSMCSEQKGGKEFQVSICPNVGQGLLRVEEKKKCENKESHMRKRQGRGHRT